MASTLRGLAVVFFGALLSAATLGQTVPSDEVPEGLSATDWSSIRGAYDAGRHAAYPVEGSYRARNSGQQWTTTFDGRVI